MDSSEEINIDLSDTEKVAKVVELCRKLNIDSGMLQKVNEILTEENPKRLDSNDVSQLLLPDYDLLKLKIGMSREVYDQTKGIWQSLGQYNYDHFKPKYTKFTSEFYQIFGEFESGVKWLYIGQVVPDSDIKQGQGIRVYSHGQFEEGYWFDGKQHGKGRCIFKHGGLYEGEWKLDKKHGNGEYTFKDGDKYIGHYCNEKRDGEGMLIHFDGTIEKGLWEAGQLLHEY